MANYTMTIQEMIEDENIDLFDFDYELSPLLQKEYLEKRFINKYYFREICYETVSMWKFKFEEEWKNKLRVYNKIFNLEKELKDINPLTDFTEDEIETIKRVVVSDEDFSSVGSSTMRGDEKLTTKDTPLSEYDTSNYVSGISTNKTEQDAQTDIRNIKSGGEDEDVERIKTIIQKGSFEKIQKYISSLKDYVEEFISSFSDMFMGIY